MVFCSFYKANQFVRTEASKLRSDCLGTKSAETLDVFEIKVKEIELNEDRR